MNNKLTHLSLVMLCLYSFSVSALDKRAQSNSNNVIIPKTNIEATVSPKVDVKPSEVFYKEITALTEPYKKYLDDYIVEISAKNNLNEFAQRRIASVAEAAITKMVLAQYKIHADRKVLFRSTKSDGVKAAKSKFAHLYKEDADALMKFKKIKGIKSPKTSGLAGYGSVKPNQGVESNVK